ncbi:MAG: hypothetical protein HUU46_11350 [Candidatus Hydrogenedentes bacterium]|nr:hypothetical protein [Candidatus Hydrogenedentota bacterium]
MEKLRILAVLLVCLVASPFALAKIEYMDDAIAKYPNISDTVLDSCSLCHTIVPELNLYGDAFKDANRSFTAIENDDSDHDGTKNIDEINALTFPGDDSSFPVPQASIKVKKPNGGETWTIGTKVQVTWNSTGDVGPDVSIELWQNGQKVKTLKGSTPNDGKQRVMLKETLPTGAGFSVRVKSVSNPSISDHCDATFDIVAPTP